MEHISAADYQVNEAAKKKKKRRKYNNRKVEADGFTFDSDKEFKRYCYLKVRQQLGEIRDLEVHPVFKFDDGRLVIRYEGKRIAKYEADSSYIEVATGEYVVEDVKSKVTRLNPFYRLKKAIMSSMLGIEVQEVIL